MVNRLFRQSQSRYFCLSNDPKLIVFIWRFCTWTPAVDKKCRSKYSFAQNTWTYTYQHLCSKSFRSIGKWLLLLWSVYECPEPRLALLLCGRIPFC